MKQAILILSLITSSAVCAFSQSDSTGKGSLSDENQMAKNQILIEKYVAPMFQKTIKKLTASKTFDHFSIDGDRLIAVIKTGGKSIKVTSDYGSPYLNRTRRAPTPEKINLVLPNKNDIEIVKNSNTGYDYSEKYYKAYTKNHEIFEVYPSLNSGEIYFGFTEAKFTGMEPQYLEVLIYGILSEDGNSFEKNNKVGLWRRGCYGPTGYGSGCFYMGSEPYDWNSSGASLHMFED